MASSYTANNGIEKIGTGEQAGTWGATTNTNFDILDRAINGVGAITLSGTTHTLTTTDGALSDGHFKVLVFGGTLSSTNTVTISPNDQDKLYFVFNNTSGSQSIIIKQGSGATVTVGNGKTAIVYADGAGSGAAVAQIETGSDEFTEDVTMKTGDGALLTLQTSDTTVGDGDVLGALQFQAPNESSGTDAITVAASIVAEADNTFAADNNQTDMVFKLGSSEAATEKMRLTHEGDLSVSTSFTIGSATITEAELEILDGATVTTAELNILDGVTSTASELNILDGVTSTASELNLLDGSSAGTVVASKAVVVDSSKNIASFGNLTATGTITSGSFVYSSDENLKKDIKTIEEPIEKIKQLRGVSYTWNENSMQEGKKSIGLIAQEVEKVLPDLVEQSDSLDSKGVNYGHLIGLLIEAIKDQQKQLDELKK
jgi:hypothetical protein